MDGLPTWVRWIFVFAVGLSPILTFWMARVLWSYLRHTAALKKRLPRSLRGKRVNSLAEAQPTADIRARRSSRWAWLLVRPSVSSFTHEDSRLRLNQLKHEALQSNNNGPEQSERR